MQTDVHCNRTASVATVQSGVSGWHARAEKHNVYSMFAFGYRMLLVGDAGSGGRAVSTGSGTASFRNVRNGSGTACRIQRLITAQQVQ